MRLHPAWIDLALVLAVLAGAGLLFIGAASLPPPRFEPMGSAALPRILGGLLIFFALIISVKAVLHLRQDALATATKRTIADDSQDVTDNGKSGLLRAGSILGALVLYVMALDVFQWSFMIVTPVFVAIVGSLLSLQRLRAFGIFGVFGVVLATIIYAVMTRFLYVDLG